MGAILCRRDGNWKLELEERLRKGEIVSLLAIGSVKYEVLDFLNQRKDIQIFRLETKYLKNRRKGLGLKAVVWKSSKLTTRA